MYTLLLCSSIQILAGATEVMKSAGHIILAQLYALALKTYINRLDGGKRETNFACGCY